MLERRTLAFIDLDDIPSSAVAITSANQNTVSGNTIYIPMEFPISTVYSIPFVRVSGQSNIYIESINGIPFTQNTIWLEYYFLISMGYINGGYNMFPRINSNKANSRYDIYFTFPMYLEYGTSNGKYVSSSSPILLSNTTFYNKVKLDAIVKINGSINNSIFQNYSPIYIGTE